MAEEDGLISAYLLDGNGGGKQIGWSEIGDWAPGQGALWVHLQRDSAETQDWLRERSGLGPVRVEVLLEEETRPRSVPVAEGLLVILRGVNLNPGADPEDMVGLRLWVEGDRVISVRSRKLMAIEDVRETLDQQRGPTTTGYLLAAIANRLSARMGPVIDELEERVDDLEGQLLETGERESRSRLQDIRREAIMLRRYLSPQRDALNHLMAEDYQWLDQGVRARIREAADRTVQYVEDLDQVRDRAAVVQDELMSRLAERMNRTMYVLTVVAAIMLPLSFVTGLLGINVAGIPGTDYKWAFLIVCIVLVLLGAFQIWLFRKFRWI
jgi:zinc transporter